VKMGGDAKNSFSCLKASSHWGVHENLSFFFKDVKKWKPFSPAHDRNLDNAAILPVSF
ncbi:hypothetical protein L195_g064086, partial [Trifolium pratense]